MARWPWIPGTSRVADVRYIQTGINLPTHNDYLPIKFARLCLDVTDARLERLRSRRVRRESRE